MRTTLHIDDDIMDQVMSHTGQNNRSKPIRLALSYFIQEHKEEKITGT